LQRISPNLRLISQQFNVLVLLVKYRKWTLKTYRMENPAASTIMKRVVDYMKHAIVQKAVDWNVVVKEFEELPQLESIT
jgi:hypothetical protein